MDEEVITELDGKQSARAFYALGGIRLKNIGKRRWVVSETAIDIHCEVPDGVRIVAPKVSLFCEQPNDITVAAKEIVAWGNPGNNISLPTVPTLLQIGGDAVTEALENKFARVYKTPKPRTSLPEGRELTNAEGDISMWHLMALGILDPVYVDDYLRAAGEHDGRTVQRDLKECMGLADEMHFYGAERIGIPGLGPRELRTIAAYRSPYEICLALKQPFLSLYQYDPKCLFPMVEALIRQTTEDCDGK